MDRYVVISADCHAGADLRDYKPFLASRYHDEFDDWADHFVNPYGDLVKPDADRNWDSARRTRDLEDDGVVAEVIYPNTIPPFFPKGGLTALSPSPDEFELRLAGLRAHNRWLSAFCAELPGRRAGAGQILLNDTDEAVRDVHWIADNGLKGALLPGMPPGVPVPPLHAPDHDPVWRACEERGVLIAAHGGSSSPDYGMYPASLSMWLMEVTWFSHRPLWSLILSGVFDRFPGLRLVLAEQGSDWIANALSTMDQFQWQIERGGIGELRFVEPQMLKRQPSEYWNENCYVAASFLHRTDCERRGLIGGAQKIMWGSDYPHSEGTFPFSEQGIRKTFAGLEHAEVQRMLAGTAVEVYGFDLDLLAPIAATCGPEVDVVAGGLDKVPVGATSMAFRDQRIRNV